MDASKPLPREQGEQFETLVAQYLAERGYRLVDRNYRNYARLAGEVDLILEKGTTLVFAEVRYRSSSAYGAPVETVDQTKRRKIVRAAVGYLIEHQVRDRDFRFDVVSVVQTRRGPRIDHFENAFDASQAFGSYLIV